MLYVFCMNTNLVSVYVIIIKLIYVIDKSVICTNFELT